MSKEINEKTLFPFEVVCKRRIEFDLEPIGKPRMTQRDKWKKRPIIQQYYAFKDHLNLLAKKQKYTVTIPLTIMFVLSMPVSWSQKRREAMNHQRHQQRPDLDNILKAYLDCLCPEDGFVAEIVAGKIWGETGKIIVWEL